VAYDPAKVDQLLENYRERMATRVPVEGRPAQEKDLAVLDFSGYLAKEDPNSDEDPQEIPGGSAEDFELELVEGRFIPGFIEGIIGMSVGETRDVSATFPDPYVQPDLAGKPAVFTITLKELKEKELPELDDDFAQEVSEFETLDELRKSLEERFQKEAEDKTSGNKQEALLKELVKYLEVDLPETLVRREIDYMVTQTAMQFANQGMDIKSIFTPELVQTMRERSRPEAIARIQRTMALGEIAKQESITVEQPEITAKMQEVLQDLQGQQDIDIDRVRQVVEEDLLRDKIFDWLEANNTIELVPEGTLTQDEDETESEPTAELVPEVEAAEAVVEVEATPVVEPEPESAAETKAPAKAKKGKSTAAPAAEATAEPEAEAEEPAAKPARKKSTKKKAEPSEES
jgi:trigger factor